MKKEKVYIAEGGRCDGSILVAASLTESEIEIVVTPTTIFYVPPVWIEAVFNTKFKFIGYL